MTDDGTTEKSTWPMPKFHFRVDLGDEFKGIAFQEVSGLDTEAQIIEYRKSDSPEFAANKIPGIANHGNVTLKRGIFVYNDAFRDWMSEITMNTIKRQTLTIKLLDENGKSAMQWQLNNAWPTKITGTDINSNGDEVAVESLEIAHDGILIKRLEEDQWRKIDGARFD